MNHFEAVCRSASTVHEIEKLDQNSNASNEFYFDSITIIDNIDVKADSLQSWHEIIKIEGANVRLKLDTGSEVNILLARVFDKINPHATFRLSQTATVLEAYGGFKIRPIGQIKLKCKHKAKEINLEFLVTEGKMKPILRLQACVTLGLIARTDTTNETINNSSQKAVKSTVNSE